MEKVKEKGCVGVFDVEEALWREKIAPRLPEKQRPLVYALRQALKGEVKTIKNFTGIYRLMRSLERRGLVATLLHSRPREWHYVDWRNGAPHIDQTKGRIMIKFLVRKKPAKLRFRSETWEIPIGRRRIHA